MTKTQIIQKVCKAMGIELITVKMVEPEIYAGTSTADRAGVSGFPKILVTRPFAKPVNYRSYTLMRRLGVK